MTVTRRTTLGTLLTGGMALSARGEAAAPTKTRVCASSPAAGVWSELKWGRGIEGQRKADLGDGTFLNPIMSGDHPDPTILKDGKDYYLTYTSNDSYPGVVIWHSRDLVNWRPLTAALKTYIGTVWACDLVKHQGRFYIYIPIHGPVRRTICVIHAERIEGPWSEPVDLKLPHHIDPGHAVGEDGTRYLFLSGGDRVKLTPEGLATAGKPEHVYDPWRYPASWDVESFSPEGPKITRRGDYFYLITAVGGTAGPPTGHMVIAARSRSIDGPWENCPHNPLVRTGCASEKWWSRGHATLVEGPGGDWWAVYHGYENDFWTLGRPTLLDRVEWTDDGWFRFLGGDLSRPIAKPKGGTPGPHGHALSDDFSADRMGFQWSFFDPDAEDAARLSRESGALVLAARGTAPRDSSPLVFTAGDQAYQLDVDVEIDPKARGGLLLFYDRKLYAGISFGADGLIAHQFGEERGHFRAPPGDRLRLRLKNDRNIVTMYSSTDDARWAKFPLQMEVSGYHHNVRGGFMALRPALFAAGEGKVRFRDLRYLALD